MVVESKIPAPERADVPCTCYACSMHGPKIVCPTLWRPQARRQTERRTER